jgi:hypothetical protein
MMRRVALAAIALITVFLSDLARADGIGREIGYIESYSDKPEEYVLHHGNQKLPIAVMTPVRSGDRIEVKNPTAKIVVRLVDRPTPITISQSNLDTPLLDTPPAHPFWTPLIAWASKQIEIFDNEERDQVAASIRGETTGFSVPLLATRQVLPAGKRAIAIGWLGTAPAHIRIANMNDRTISSGDGTDGLWYDTELEYEPGRYTIELSIGSSHVKQELTFVRPSEWSGSPAELARNDVPVQLREVATAAWLASRDLKFSLAAFQRVAPIASESRAANLLARALIRGERPDSP